MGIRLLLAVCCVLSLFVSRGSVAQGIDEIRNKLVAISEEILKEESSFAPKEDKKFLEKVKSAVSKRLKDPYSAQFEDFRVIKSNGIRMVCGRVNAKNEFGGYTGSKPFVAGAESFWIAASDDAKSLTAVGLYKKHCASRS